MKLEWKNLWKTGFVVLVFFLVYKYADTAKNLFFALLGALSPLIAGCVIAFLINIILDGFEKIFFPKSKNQTLIKLRRPLCIALSFVLVFAMISALFSIVMPQFISCLKLIINLLPDAAKWVVVKLDNFEFIPQSIVNVLNSIDWRSKINEIVSLVTNGIGSTVQIVFSTLTSIFSGIINAFIGIIFAVYVLLCKDRLVRQWSKLMKAYVPEKVSSRIGYVLKVFNESFRKYIIGQTSEAVILGVLCLIGMLAFRLPYAAMISTLIAFTALIPIAGAYIGGAIGALMILPIAPYKAFIFIVFLIILQQIEGNLIYPRVVGSSIGLPGMWVLASVTVGGSIGGIPGMLLGVPLTASVYRIIRHDVRRRCPDPKPKEEKAPEKSQEKQNCPPKDK